MKTYEELVEAGRKAGEKQDQAHWERGDLALEVEALPGHPGPEDTPLQRYAKDLDVSWISLRTWRDTSTAWPRDRRRSRNSWSTHRTLNAQPDRFELIDRVKSKAEATKIVRDRDRPVGKPEVLPSSFGDRLVHATGQLQGSDTAFDNLMRANDGRAFRQRHLEVCARAADIMEARAELLRRIGNGEFERIEAATFMEVLRRPWAGGRMER